MIREEVEEEEATPVIENGPDVVPTIAMVGDATSVKRAKLSYENWSKEDLVEDIKKRRKKPGKMCRKMMADFFEKEDKIQRHIPWHTHDKEDEILEIKLRGSDEVEGKEGETQD